MTSNSITGSAIRFAMPLVTSAVGLYLAQKFRRQLVEQVLLPSAETANPSASSPRLSFFQESRKITHIEGIADITDQEVIKLLNEGLIEDLTEARQEETSPQSLFNQTFVDAVEGCLHRATNDRVLIHGASGAGKTTFIHHLTDRILQGKSILAGRRVFLVKARDERIFNVLSRSMTETCLLVIDEAHHYIPAENMLTRVKINPEHCGLSIALKLQSNNPRTQGALPPILAATNEPTEITDDPALNRRFGLQIAIPDKTNEERVEELKISLPSFLERWVKLKYPGFTFTLQEVDRIAEILVYLVPKYTVGKKIATQSIDFFCQNNSEKSCWS